MDIQIYENIYNGLKSYMEENTSGLYGASIVHYPTASPTYPYVVFEEIRNQPNGHSYGEIPDVVANLGYRVRIFAKTKGSVSKMTIARSIAAAVNSFLTNYVGLKQVSFNPDPFAAEGEVYGVVTMYNTNYYENKQQIRK